MGSRSFRLEGPARRIAIAIAVIVALVVAAIAIVIWRYEASRDSDNAALRESQTQLVAQQARTALTDEGGIVAAYAANKDPADLFALQGRKRQLRRALDTLQQSDALSAAELDRVRQIEAGQEHLDGLFTDKVLPVAGTRRFDTGVKPFEAAVTKLEAKLDSFIAGLGDDSARAAAAARSDASEAKTIAIIAAALAALAALATGIYIVRLIGLLLERIRTSAATLAEMAVEMRAGSAEAATATNRQSTAVAEVAATAEELSATAASIADNAKAGTTAVERTGDVMGTMQGQVQAISERSLALGERSQRIGEVLELINEIAEQTNLLALNAAIEAARAGEAGKGFAVVASEVRKLAERSIRSTDEIREILTSVQDETNATIMATEQGAKQAREVGTLMGSTAEVLEESLRATEQQREAAEQVSSSIVQVRAATEKLAAELEERSARSEQLEALVGQLERTLVEHGLAVRDGDGAVVRRRER